MSKFGDDSKKSMFIDMADFNKSNALFPLNQDNVSNRLLLLIHWITIGITIGNLYGAL